MLPELPTGSTFQLRYARCPAAPENETIDVQLLPGARGDSPDYEHHALAAVKAMVGRSDCRFRIEHTPSDRFSVTYIGHLRVWCRDIRPDDITARRILHRAASRTADVGLRHLLLTDESGRWRGVVRSLADAAARSPAAANHPIDNIEAVLADAVLQYAGRQLVRSEL